MLGKILIYTGVAILGVFLLDTVRSLTLFVKSRHLVENSVPFQQKIENAQMDILVLGDSTAVGTGVTDPQLSTAGRLGTLYPEANIENLAENGLRLSGLSSMLETRDADENFSLVLVQIGANDIIRFTSLKAIEEELEVVLSTLSQRTERLVLLHSGNVGEAPFFPRYLRSILSKRSYEMREMYRNVSSRHGAEYIDLIDSPTGDLLRENPTRYYAEDLLHLSNEGYGLWFSEIKKKLDS